MEVLGTVWKKGGGNSLKKGGDQSPESPPPPLDPPLKLDYYLTSLSGENIYDYLWYWQCKNVELCIVENSYVYLRYFYSLGCV